MGGGVTVMDDETGIWIECYRCGKAFGGSGVIEAVRPFGRENLCNECLAASRGCGATETARGANTQ
jgi:hypothetical protein